jgi:hypothetical protein
MDKDKESKGHAIEHNPQKTQESEFIEIKSISIRPRAIGTSGPNFNEEVGQRLAQIPHPTQNLSL